MSLGSFSYHNYIGFIKFHQKKQVMAVLRMVSSKVKEAASASFPAVLQKHPKHTHFTVLIN